MITDKIFWKNALMRALKTFLQVIAGVWTAGQLITDIDWQVVLLSAASAAVYSLLMSAIGGLPEVDCERELMHALDNYTTLESEELDDAEEDGDIDE